jgi:hypothetical protein
VTNDIRTAISREKQVKAVTRARRIHFGSLASLGMTPGAHGAIGCPDARVDGRATRRAPPAP